MRRYKSTMDMYGGRITGGNANGNGGGGAIALDDIDCVFNMYGGELSGNKSAKHGGAILLEQVVKLELRRMAQLLRSDEKTFAAILEKKANADIQWNSGIWRRS